MPERDFYGRLYDCIRRSNEQMKSYRERRRDAVMQIAGRDYGDNKVGQEPLNMLYAAIATFVPIVVARNPAPDITTDHRELRPLCYAFEKVNEALYRTIGLEQTLRKLVTDAWVNAGIAKTYLGPESEQGAPTVEAVSLDDFVVDPDALSFESAVFVGNKYLLFRDYILSSGLFENTEGLSENETEALGGQKKTRDVGAKRSPHDRRLYPVVEVYDIWLPPGNPIGGSRGVVLTLPPETVGISKGPLRVVEWDGPDSGPYDLLGFFDLPDHVMPVAPAASLLALNTLINSIARKMKRQAERQKTIGIYEPDAQEDAENIRRSSDGEMVSVANVSKVGQLSLGGVNENIYGFCQWLLGVFSKQGGNINLIGGLASDARTATEAALLQENSDARVSDMKHRVYKFTERIMEKLAYFLWTDPLADFQTSRMIGTTEGMERFGPGRMMGMARQTGMMPEFSYYNVRISPYSMEDTTPESRVQKLMNVIQQVILPTAQIAAAQGSVLNVDALVQTVAKEMRVSDLTQEIYLAANPSSAAAVAPIASPPQMPSRGRRITIGNPVLNAPGPEGIPPANQMQGMVPVESRA